MSATQLVVALLAILTVLNSVALVGVVRQIGLLHVRVRPFGALQTGTGLLPGAKVVLPGAETALADLPVEVSRVIFAFVSPTCRLCEPLLPSFRVLAREGNGRDAIFLVTDVAHDRAETYFKEKRLHLPVIAHEEAFRTNGVAGAPFVAVTDRGGIVLSSGGVNSLEQVEMLLDASRAPEVSSEIDAAEGTRSVEAVTA